MLKINLKTRPLKLVSALLCCGVLLALFFILPTTKTTTPSKTEDIKVLYSEKYEGFEKQTEISKIIIPDTGEIYEKITVLKDHDKPTYIESDKKTDLKNNKYEIQYRIKKLNEKYIDISFLINKNNNTLKTTISGLAQNENISMRLNEESIFKNIPADWAGKIKLESYAFLNNKNTKVCTFISDKMHTSQSICHHIKIKENIT